MCGIFGYIDRQSNAGLLNDMGDLLEHRGPDDVGLYTDETTGTYFGLRRLSIIDLEGGHQPLCNEDRSVWVACNGEIYNYVELRKDLQERGHRFCTASDVETLVHLYEERGLDFLDEVNGMFGLVLYDRLRRRLILARDRIGIKPLYYATHGRRLAFASEIKPILRCPWISRNPDWDALSAYLHLFYIPAPRTGFVGISKLPSGSMAVVENDTVSLRRYWQLDDHLAGEAKEKMTLDDAADRLRELIADACRLQLRSDVPVGAFLSGGIDSSAVVRFANEGHAASMQTYTIGWADASEKMDERGYAREVAERCRCTYNEKLITWSDFDQLLPMLAWHLEEPNADGAYVPTYLISRFSSRTSKVILTGAGGDELFGGYGHYLRDAPLDSLLRSLLPGWMSDCLQGAFRHRAFMFPWPLVFPNYRYGQAAAFLKPFHAIQSPDRLNREMAFDLKAYLQDNILFLTDKMSMAASIEARVPLLDHRIIEFVAGLPSVLKIGTGDTKLIFKAAMNGHLPASILRRQKDGFGAPIHSWMKGAFNAISRSVLERGMLVRNGVLTRQDLRRLYSLVRVRQTWSWAPWVLLNLELWFRYAYEPANSPADQRLSRL